MNVSLWIGNREFKLNLKKVAANGFLASLDASEFQVRVELLNPEEMLLNIDGQVYDVLINGNDSCYSICLNGKCFEIEKRSAAQMMGTPGGEKKTIDVKTSMPGRVVKILVETGQEVAEGQPVLILEAMKMQNEIKSPKAGVLSRVVPEAGQTVETNSVLFTVE